MTILTYLGIAFIFIFLCAYVFWIKLKKGKPGRISGAEVESKTYDEALVIDVRWNKEYARRHAVNAINIPIKVLRDGSNILDSYKEKDIILYCVVDITSRNTEKILRDRGFTKLHIGDGVKQYPYGEAKFKNVIMAEMKYLRTRSNHILLNVGDIEFESTERKSSKEKALEAVADIDNNTIIFVYSDNANDSLEVSKTLANNGKNIINLIEPMDVKKYTFTPLNKKDFLDVPVEQQISDCG